MAKVSRPGNRDMMLDGRGVVSPRWGRFFDELSGANANVGDVLIVTPDGTQYAPAETATAVLNMEFMEFWRGN